MFTSEVHTQISLPPDNVAAIMCFINSQIIILVKIKCNKRIDALLLNSVNDFNLSCKIKRYQYMEIIIIIVDLGYYIYLYDSMFAHMTKHLHLY